MSNSRSLLMPASIIAELLIVHALPPTYWSVCKPIVLPRCGHMHIPMLSLLSCRVFTPRPFLLSPVWVVADRGLSHRADSRRQAKRTRLTPVDGISVLIVGTPGSTGVRSPASGVRSAVLCGICHHAAWAQCSQWLKWFGLTPIPTNYTSI